MSNVHWDTLSNDIPTCGNYGGPGWTGGQKIDRSFLDNKAFKALGAKGSFTKPEKLHTSKFRKGTKAHDESDRLIYNPKSGVLLYDPDGTGKAASVKIAVLSTKLALGAKDFFVV